MRPRLIAVVLACRATLFAQATQCSIRGHVEDAAQAGLPALFHVLPKNSATTIFSGKAEPDGQFCVPSLSPGIYTVKAWLNGFQTRRVLDVVVKGGETTDLGTVVLKIGGCDAPGVICDSVIPDEDIRSQTDLYVRLECGADLDNLKVVCPASKAFANNIDIVFAKEDGDLFLRPKNGARIDSKCSGTYRDEALAVNGFGPGDDFCVKTKKGRASHLFFEVNDVLPGTREIIVWVVTRK